jgi:hypothetical protein
MTWPVTYYLDLWPWPLTFDLLLRDNFWAKCAPEFQETIWASAQIISPSNVSLMGESQKNPMHFFKFNALSAAKVLGFYKQRFQRYRQFLESSSTQKRKHSNFLNFWFHVWIPLVCRVVQSYKCYGLYITRHCIIVWKCKVLTIIFCEKMAIGGMTRNIRL